MNSSLLIFGSRSKRSIQRTELLFYQSANFSYWTFATVYFIWESVTCIWISRRSISNSLKKCRWSVSLASRGCHTDVMDINIHGDLGTDDPNSNIRITSGDPSHPNTLFPGDSSDYPLHPELKPWSDPEIKSRSGSNEHKSRDMVAQTQAWSICT